MSVCHIFLSTIKHISSQGSNLEVMQKCACRSAFETLNTVDMAVLHENHPTPEYLDDSGEKANFVYKNILQSIRTGASQLWEKKKEVTVSGSKSHEHRILQHIKYQVLSSQKQKYALTDKFLTSHVRPSY